MPCYNPLSGWYSRERTKLGKRRIAFRFKEGFHDLPVTVPCGRCVGCVLERARQWSVRCVHEAQLWPMNSFVTLTYRPEVVPVVPGGAGLATLRPRDFQLFMKRLRKEVEHRIRFFQAGEYGSRGRPHHHALLFNCDFPDRTPFRETESKEVIYRSEALERLWSLGFCSIGEVTRESAAYVARYTTKKVLELDPEVPGEASRGCRGCDSQGRVKEYVTMSRKPGIGFEWFRRFHSDVYPLDKMVLRDGQVVRPPRYYDDLYARGAARSMAKLKRERVGKVVRSEQSSIRLWAKQENARRRVADFLKRNL